MQKYSKLQKLKVETAPKGKPFRSVSGYPYKYRVTQKSKVTLMGRITFFQFKFREPEVEFVELVNWKEVLSA